MMGFVPIKRAKTDLSFFLLAEDDFEIKNT